MNTSSGIDEILARHAPDRANLIPLLQDIQENLGYLPENAIEELSRAISVSPNEIYGVATFYAQFRFRPPAEHNVCVCQGTACHVRGGWRVLKEAEDRLGIKAGESTPDSKVDLERVACMGCCALAPVVVVDGKVHAGMSAKRLRPMLTGLQEK